MGVVESELPVGFYFDIGNPCAKAGLINNYVESRISARLQMVEILGAAYIQSVGIYPQEACIYEQTLANGTVKIWIGRKDEIQ